MLGFTAQSAMEYLMTYGWAIIVILVVLAVLYTIGVFTPGATLGNSCSGNFKFTCSYALLSTNGTISFDFGQNTGSTIYNLAFACTETKNATGGPYAATSPWYYVGSNGQLLSNPTSSFSLESGRTIRLLGLPCFGQDGAVLEGGSIHSDITSLSGTINLGQRFTGILWVRYTVRPGPAGNEANVWVQQQAGIINAQAGATGGTVPTSSSTSTTTVSGSYYTCYSCQPIQAGYSCPASCPSNTCPPNSKCGAACIKGDIACYTTSVSTTSISTTSASTTTIPPALISLTMNGLSNVQDIAISPQGNSLYVTNYPSPIDYLNTSTGTIFSSQSNGFSSLIGIAVSPSGNTLYVTQGDGTVSVVNTSTGTILKTFSGFADPVAIAVSPSGNTIYVTDGSIDALINVANSSTGTVLYTIPGFPNLPYGITVSPDGSTLYVANHGNQTVSVVNASTGHIVQNIGVSGAWGIAISPNGTRLYVTDQSEGAVTILNRQPTSIWQTDGTYGGFSGPFGIAVSPAGSPVYVMNSNQTISVATFP